MCIHMGQTWAIMFEFLDLSSNPDADAYCATISAADVTDDPCVTASSLGVRTPTALAIQVLRGCTLANDLGLMGSNCETWMLCGMKTVDWDNCQHLLLRLQTVWKY